MSEPSISIASRDFRDVIAMASLAVERRNTVPILGALRVRANGSFEATGTDLDVMVTARVDHGGGPKAEFCLAEAANVVKAIQASGAERIQLARADGKVSIASGALALKVGNSYPVDDFPADAANMASESFTATLSHEQIRSLARVASAVSTEETRYYLNGIYIHHVDGSTYRAVATDGHRMCFVDMELPDAAGSLPGIIIPRKAIRLLLGMAGKPSPADGGAAITVGSVNAPNRETSTAPERANTPTRARLALRVGKLDVGLSTKLIDGTFPDYRRVIPNGTGKTFLFQSADLKRAIEAVTCGAGRQRALKLSFGADGCSAAACYVETGIDSTFRIDCQHTSPGFEVGFNGGYLMTMLDAAGSGEIVINTEDAASPALLKNPADTAWTGVLMPMRVS